MGSLVSLTTLVISVKLFRKSDTGLIFFIKIISLLFQHNYAKITNVIFNFIEIIFRKYTQLVFKSENELLIKVILIIHYLTDLIDKCSLKHLYFVAHLFFVNTSLVEQTCI